MFPWLKWLHLAVTLELDQITKFDRMLVHKALKKLFYQGHVLIPCAVCARKLFIEDATLDHIVPRSKAGTYDTFNLTITCGKCNNGRSSNDFWVYRHSKKAAMRRGNRRSTIVFLPGTV